MNRIGIIVAAIALAVVGPTALAKAPKSPDEFVQHAIRGDIGEIQLGQLAQQRGQSEGVKQYGQTLATDHQQAEDKAVELAGKMNVEVPDQPLDKQQQTYQKLSQLSGEQFDRHFLKYAVKDHKKDIREFSEEAQQTDNDQVAQFARLSLPTLRKHLEIAQQLQSQ